MNTEVLIVGQGISGTFLSYFLQKAGISCIVVDNHFSRSPSRIAAGIINPVTGRRLVTVWMVDEILPFARKSYDCLGKDLNLTAITRRDIVDFFPNPFMRENFLQKIAEGDQYVSLPDNQDKYSDSFQYEFGFGLISPAYTVHLEIILPAWRNELLKNGRLLEETFDTGQLSLEKDAVRYKEIKADKIVFCDGPAGFSNPYFKKLPFAPNKGEALLLEIPGLTNARIFKKGLLLAPLTDAGRDIYWAGASYAWEFNDDQPTVMFRQKTEETLNQWLRIPFRVIDHRAALRPATLERRPFVGFHPSLPSIGILNGMGTKGCSLAPFFAKQLTDFITDQKPIAAAADIRRFAGILKRE